MIKKKIKQELQKSEDDDSNLVSDDELDIFLDRFNSNLAVDASRSKKVKAVKNIMKKYEDHIPERYLEGFEDDELFLRKFELLSKKTMSPEERFEPLKTDLLARDEMKSGKRKIKKSTCTQMWNESYPDSKSVEEKSKITGIPKPILDKVVEKGMGAFYSSGSRPGQTPTSWGLARMNCFILNKATVTDGPDKKLYLQAIQESKAAKLWYAKHQKWRP